MHVSTKIGIGMFCYAMALLACKNVVAAAATAADSARERRLPEAPKETYRVLKIRPMGGGRKSRVENGGEPVPIAAHLRCGGFRDYRQGKGLFGKLHGRWWWSGRVVGDAAAGVRLKDYALSVPGGPKPEP